MVEKIYKNNLIKLKTLYNCSYLEKNNIILDKTCPKCNRLIIKDKDFCECGFFLKAQKNSNELGYFLVTWIFIGIIALISTINFYNVKNYFLTEVHKKVFDSKSLTPVNIRIISKLKNSSFDDYIEDIYLKPGTKNRLMVLIKPTLWNTLTRQEKENLIKEISENWSIIYRQDNPDPAQKPVVRYANLD